MALHRLGSMTTIAALCLSTIAACQKSESVEPASPQPILSSSAAVALVAPTANALPISPFTIQWTSPAPHPFTEEVGADGKLSGENARFEGASLKVHDNVELTVGTDGAITNGHGFPFGKFTPDDALVLQRFPRTFRLLDDGRVVAENSDGSNRVFLGATVDPPSPAVRRAALLEVAFFVSLSPPLRALANKGN